LFINSVNICSAVRVLHSAEFHVTGGTHDMMVVIY